MELLALIAVFVAGYYLGKSNGKLAANQEAIAVGSWVKLTKRVSSHDAIGHTSVLSEGTTGIVHTLGTGPRVWLNADQVPFTNINPHYPVFACDWSAIQAIPASRVPSQIRKMTYAAWAPHSDEPLE
jgi:hypothetical protein